MHKLKISQVQFQASHVPALNAKIIEKSFNNTLKFKPHLICTPECSNIITDNKNYLIYKDILDNELEIIIKMDYSSYFLIVSDYIRWAKKNNLPIPSGHRKGIESLIEIVKTAKKSNIKRIRTN